MLYNPDFMDYSVSSHNKSLSQKQELYTIWKYFKNLLFFHNTSLYTLIRGVLKQDTKCLQFQHMCSSICANLAHKCVILAHQDV